MADTKINCGGDYYFKCSENIYDSCKRYKTSAFKGKVKLKFYDEKPAKCKEIYNFLKLPVAKKNDFWNQRGRAMGSYYGAVNLIIEMNKSDCSMDMKANQLPNKELTKKEIRAFTPKKLRGDLKKFFYQADWDIQMGKGEEGSLKELINKKKAEGVNCEVVQVELLTRYSNGKKIWEKEIKKSPF